MEITTTTGWYNTFPKSLQKKLLKLTLSSGVTKHFIKNLKWKPYAVVAWDKKKPVGWCFFFHRPKLSKKLSVEMNQIHFFVDSNYRKQGIAKQLGEQMLKYLQRYRSKEVTRVMPWDDASTKLFNWFKKQAKKFGKDISVGWGNDYWTMNAHCDIEALRARASIETLRRGNPG